MAATVHCSPEDGEYEHLPPRREGKIYLYTLQNPQTREPRYIGQTVEPQQRLARHLSYKAQTHKSRWIESLGKQDLTPRMEVFARVPEEDANEYEKAAIRAATDDEWRLTNLTEGGEGVRLTPEALERRNKAISEARKGDIPWTAINASAEKRRGKPMPEEQKQKISESMTGKNTDPLDPERRKRVVERLQTWREENGNPFKGCSHTEEAKRAISEKKKGQIPPNKGVPHSEKTRERMAEAWERRKKKWRTGIPPEKRRKSRAAKIRGIMQEDADPSTDFTLERDKMKAYTARELAILVGEYP